MKRRVLLVGDDQSLWQEFHEDTAHGWQVEIARTGLEALAWIQQDAFDAIVADFQVAGTDGLELLDELARVRPESRRVILSDISDSEQTLKCVGKAHRFLVKPCDTTTLVGALNEVMSIDQWVPGPAVQRLLPAMRWIPSPPSIYFQVVSEMRSPDASIEKVGELIARDPAMTAKMLQLANSAVFGLRLQVMHPIDAVAFIGLETTKSLLLLTHTFASFENLQASGFRIEALWRHSLMTGQFARSIAMLEQSSRDVAEQAFAAGLLHDIGKLLFAANLPVPFGEAMALSRKRKKPLWEAEMEVIGTCHGQIGAALLGLWGLPAPLVEAIALHHFPGCRGNFNFSPLTAVHVANALEHEAMPGNAFTGAAAIDPGYICAGGFENQLQEWRCDCLAQTARLAPAAAV